MFAKSLKLFIILALATFILIVRGTTGFTQEDSIDPATIQMTVNAGFGGYYRPDVQSPLSVEIANNGTRVLDGRIRIRTTQWPPPTIYSCQVNVPPGEKRIYEMFFYEGVAQEIKISIIDKNRVTIADKTVPLFPARIEPTRIELTGSNSTVPIGIAGDALILSISGKADNFSFLESATYNTPGLFRFNQDVAQTDMPRGYLLTNAWITRSTPQQLSSNLMAWNPLSTVFCDLRSYEALDKDFKTRLRAWVNLGGELLLYPPEDYLTEPEIAAINNDTFLPFKIKPAPVQVKISESGRDIFNAEALKYLMDVDYTGSSLVYVDEDSSQPLIGSMAVSGGGITLFHFNPVAIKTEKTEIWVGILFHLGLLTPETSEIITHTSFSKRLSGGLGRTSDIPEHNERVASQMGRGAWRLLLMVIIPLCIIALTAMVFLRRGKKLIFIIYVFPVLLILALTIPNALITFCSFDSRHFEGYTLLNLSDENSPGLIYSTYLVLKNYPDYGEISFNRPDGYSFYDESVSTSPFNPVVRVDCTPPGSFRSLERSSTEYRMVLSMSELDRIGGINGSVKVNKDGSVQYEITNTTAFNLTNCEIFPANPNKNLTTQPVMIPDIAAGQTIKGKLESMRDDVSVDNLKIAEFISDLKPGIFSPESRQEKMYSLETAVSGTAYKASRPAFVYSTETRFFAWTRDYNSGMKIGKYPGVGPMSTLITARIKMSHESGDTGMKVESIKTLIPIPQVTPSVRQ